MKVEDGNATVLYAIVADCWNNSTSAPRNAAPTLDAFRHPPMRNTMGIDIGTP